MTDTDQTLVAAARDGDRAALEKLLERHQSAVYRFGMKMCGESEDAKDVLQETLFAAARTLPDFRGASSVSTWLYTIARSFCLKKRRTSKFAPERIESLEAQPETSGQVADARRNPEEDAVARQLKSVLDAAIAELEPIYREVLLLRDVEGLPAAEVAEVLGISVEAVKSRLHRARVAVRERVAPVLAPATLPIPQPGPGCQDVVTMFSRRLEGEIDVERLRRAGVAPADVRLVPRALRLAPLDAHALPQLRRGAGPPRRRPLGEGRAAEVHPGACLKRLSPGEGALARAPGRPLPSRRPAR